MLVKEKGKSNLFGRLLILLVAAFLSLGPLTSCRPLQTHDYAIGTCYICKGTGTFGSKSCPTCQGLGYIRVHYRYPVIEPVK